MDAEIAKWGVSRQRKALLISKAIGRLNGKAVGAAATTTIRKTARSGAEQAAIDRRKRLYQACLDASAEGKGDVSFSQADTLAEQAGNEAAVKLIRTFGEAALVELLAKKYWETH